MTPTADSIAVIGMACRFPGGDGVRPYWDTIREGRCVVGPPPADRPAGDERVRGGFLPGIDRFDAEFFGISAAEAQRMDPQQRMLLEVAWHALEDAGVNVDTLAGTATGVYVGVHSLASDYYRMQSGDANTYTGTGALHGMFAGRLAYLLDLRGPAMAVDTACSSALVAVHLAMRSLRAGESELAVGGGVNVTLTQMLREVGTHMGLPSASGQCRPFDAGADGIVNGEGCGVVVLKRLTDAEGDNDRVLGVLLGSAIGQDGRSNGATAPNPLAQWDVIRQALLDAGVEANQVSYVEAHGTGTPLGDPIELEALAEAFAPGALPRIGSVKANIGHLEGAAGIASLIKVLLMLHHGEIPRQPHFRQPNPAINVPGYPDCVPTVTRAWPAGPGARIGGISSFGWSETNAHVLVAEAATPAPAQQTPTQQASGPELLTISARSQDTLHELAARYASDLAAGGSVADLCFTANTGRSGMPHRLALTALDPADLHARLARFLADEPVSGLHRNTALRRPRVAFLFSGQGDHYLGMGWELFADVPVFADTIRQCDRLAEHWLPPRAIESIVTGNAPPELATDASHAQLALVSVQVALATMWRSWGVEPTAVLGHSIGEFAAAHVAGAVSLADCLLLVAERARAFNTLPAGG